MAGAEENSPMSSTYTYNDYLRDFLKDASCILAYDTAADYLELWSGSMNPLTAKIYVCKPLHIKGTTEYLSSSFEAVEHENRLAVEKAKKLPQSLKLCGRNSRRCAAKPKPTR